MKLLSSFILLISLMLVRVEAQQNANPPLQFNRPFYELENQWVAFPPNPATGKSPFGYVYVDAMAGFTFHVEGYFAMDANGKLSVDKQPVNNILIIRLQPNTKPVYAIPDNMLELLGVQKVPFWLSSYRSDMNTVAAKVNWGRNYNSAGAPRKALEYLESAYRTDPHADGLEFELTYAYNELREFDKSIAVLNDAIKNKPDNVMFYRELGYSYMGKSDLDGAMKVFLKGIEMCGERNLESKAEMAWNLATVYRTQKNDAEFIKWGQNAKTWAPPGTDIYKKLLNVTFNQPH
jgi:tetratricopeptide (TPR) repeat protein